LICTNRKVAPRSVVSRMPALKPFRSSFLIETRAQCRVSEELSRMAVLTPAMATGSSVPAAGHSAPCTTRMKK